VRFLKIDVDEEVYDYLKEKAEPFTDTPNTVLRRLLFMDNKQNPPKRADAQEIVESTDNDIKGWVPAALRQTLEVIRLVINGQSRPGATHLVAKRHNIAPQTVLDKYCRQLGIDASKFDYLLEQPGRTELTQLLIKNFPKHGDLVRKYVGV
jgi:uncharacterized protein YfbU (UPF0304 family)